MTDATSNSRNPNTHIQARQQADGEQPNSGAGTEPRLIPMRYLPLPLRCAVEVFLASGDRTKPRLLELIDHFLAAYGLASSDERELYIESAAAHVKRVAYLSTEEGF